MMHQGKFQHSKSTAMQLFTYYIHSYFLLASALNVLKSSLARPLCRPKRKRNALHSLRDRVVLCINLILALNASRASLPSIAIELHSPDRSLARLGLVIERSGFGAFGDGGSVWACVGEGSICANEGSLASRYRDGQAETALSDGLGANDCCFVLTWIYVSYLFSGKGLGEVLFKQSVPMLDGQYAVVGLPMKKPWPLALI